MIILAAGNFINILVGDAQTMSGNARGGNDKLISGSGNDDMWGDAQVILGKAQGGNDTLFSIPTMATTRSRILVRVCKV